MDIAERMQKLLAATPEQLESIDEILSGKRRAGRDGGDDADMRLVTLTEAARLLNLSRPTIHNMVRKGRLEVVKLDKLRRVRMASLQSFAAGKR